jgi:hypothetical protein
VPVSGLHTNVALATFIARTLERLKSRRDVIPRANRLLHCADDSGSRRHWQQIMRDHLPRPRGARVLRQAVGELAIDQYEGNPTRLTRTVGPAVIRTALDDNVARSNGGLANVHDEGQVALSHDSIVDGFGAVHEGVARACSGVRRGSGGTRVHDAAVVGSFFFTQLVLLLMLNWRPSLIGGLGLTRAQASWTSVCFNLGGSVGAGILGSLHAGERRRPWVMVTYIGMAVTLAALPAVGKIFALAALACALAGGVHRRRAAHTVCPGTSLV